MLGRHFTYTVLVSLLAFTQGPADESRTLEIRMLANEGFVMSAGERSVAIDAFVAEPYVGYGALAGDVLASLRSASGEFAGLDVVLASHFHRDHFQGAPAQQFLASSPKTMFVSSPQVIDALFDAEAKSPSGFSEDSVRAVYPAPAEEETIEWDGIRVTFLNLSHGTGRFKDIENMGHVITIDGITALHIGDAEMEKANFAPYKLDERGIDVAFVPYWYFGSVEGRTIVDAYFRPAKLIACHIKPGELKQVTADLARDFPDVIVPQEALELHRVADGR